MTHEEKAKELVKKFYEAAIQMNFNESRGWFIDEEQSKINAKQCAAICVQREIDLLNSMPLQDATRAWRKEMQDELQSVLTSIQKQ